MYYYTHRGTASEGVLASVLLSLFKHQLTPLSHLSSRWVWNDNNAWARKIYLPVGTLLPLCAQGPEVTALNLCKGGWGWGSVYL